MENSLQTIFNEVQTCDSKRFSENLIEAVNLIPKDNNFLNIINSILLCQKASIPSKILYFIRRIFEELHKSNGTILNAILFYLTDKISCKNARIRKNSIKLIAIILKIYKESSHNSNLENIINKINEALFDKDQGVRKEAIKICLMYQNIFISKNITVQSILKDAIRYDQSHEIRKIGLIGLEVNNITLNCILERCIDVNVSIRKIFWDSLFSQIDVNVISKSQRIFLLKKAFNEREFLVKDIFIKRITEIGFLKSAELFFCDEPEYDEFLLLYLNITGESFELTEFAPWYLHLICLHYKNVEEKMGRDLLKLIPIENHLSILYSKCNELEIESGSECGLENTTKMKLTVKYLFRLLRFYDIFLDSEKKQILSIIQSQIVKSNIAEIVEEGIILAKRICDSNIIQFLGSIIKKTRGTTICFLICENIIKHIPFSPLHDAILNEIAMMDLGQSINIIYWYFVNKPSDNLKNLYLSFLPNIKAVNGATDLILMNKLDTIHINDLLLSQITKLNESFVIPVSKLLLAQKIENPEFIKYLLVIFYSSKLENTEQYLSLFFYEFFKKHPIMLVKVYCYVLELIESNQKVFIDQSLFWISNCQDELYFQKLFFEICIFILNNYDELKNKKYHFSTLEHIVVSSKWEPAVTKKIIYLIGVINRKRTRENISNLLNRLMQIDNGSPMPNYHYEELKALIINQ